MNCRFCKNLLEYELINLGMTPLANSYLSQKNLHNEEKYYPLSVMVCNKCFLVQLSEDATSPENIFSDYAYFSSYSKTWMNHSEDFSKKMVDKFSLNQNDLIVEIASNDGYLLKNFKDAGTKILGIEPASNISEIAEKNGIPTINKFFGNNLATELKETTGQSDLLIAINVMPHVPDLHDFTLGMKTLLKPDGVLIIQFSTYLLPFLKDLEFDSIYHEHFSYFSLLSLKKILNHYNLQVFDVEELDIHGGSLRVYVKHMNNSDYEITSAVSTLENKEKTFGMSSIPIYDNFKNRVLDLKLKIWEFLITSKRNNKKVIAYGAPAKGNTLLNFCGIGKELINYTVDISPHKQELYLPGTHIPIYHPDKLLETKPDFLIILPWNLKNEIVNDANFIRNWGGKFVTFIPEVSIF